MKYRLKILLCFLPIISFGQTFNCKTFTANQGLPSSYINTIFQDKDGYLWIGTYGGLSRFDGTNFKNFTVNEGLGCNQITQILQSKNGNLLLGTFFGLTIYNGLTFSNIDNVNGISIERSRTLIEAQNGTIWGGCRNGLWSLDSRGKMSIFNKDKEGKVIEKVWCLYELSPNKILVGGPAKLYLFDGKTFTEIKDQQGNSIEATSIKKYQDKIIIGTYEKGWQTYENAIIKPFIRHSLIDSVITYRFVIDKKNRLLAATSKGLMIVDKTNIQQIEDKNGLPNRLVLDVFVDSESNTWATTPEGLVQIKDSFIEKSDHTNGLLNDEVFNINTDNQGELYFCSFTDVIYKYHNKKFEVAFKLNSNNLNTAVTFVRQDSHQNFWIADDVNAVFLIQKGKTCKVQGVSKYILAFAEDISKNIIWLGGRGVLFRYFDGKIETIPFKGDDILSFFIDAQHRLWLGSKGLWMFDGKRFYDYSKETQTENVLIQAIETDAQGNLFLGTIGKGIRKVRIEKMPVLLEKINISEGLTNESIMDLEFDKQGQLWVSSFGGILRMNVSNPKINGKYATRVFDLNDGIINNSWRNVPLQKDQDGNIWAGTPKGAMKFRLADMIQNTQAPKVHINRLQLFQENVDWEKANQKLIPFSQLPDNLILTANQNFLTFHFTGISLSNPQNIYYSYKLDGLDTRWSPATQQNNINYSKLSAGNYTFSVKAMNSDGVWSEPTSYSFEIKPAFWQTWWFRLLIVMLATGAIYWFLKNREKRINERNQYELQMTELKLKALQSQMNPHFLFNSLNSVQNYILTNRGIEGAKYLSKFSKLVRKIMENSNHQFLRFEEIIETLKMYVELESFRFNHEFLYEFDIENDENLLETPLPPMLLQPFVENSIWHGLMPKEGNKQLIIKAFRKDNYIFCSIEDNGVGRKNSQPRAEGHISRGQEMTKGIFDSLRQSDNDAKLEIIDLFDSENNSIGTRVEMVIPIT